MSTRKGLEISLSIVMAFMLVIILIAVLGVLTNNYAGRFVDFGGNATNTSLIKSITIISGIRYARSN
ncbi:hypothetical protein [Candidatus Nanohalovita haloferacivicina]|uniref:hypothetical protein n=1 Tax=Candidatus Nanohalovita haloferacivicina TaxID=2978046 RepID=UPI00325FCC8E